MERIKATKIELGESYGKRQVIAKGCMNKYGQQFWWVQCECLSDPYKAIRLQILNSPSCKKCSPRKQRKDLVGNTYNNLKVLEHVGSDSNNTHRYRCECLLCGNDQHIVRSNHLVAEDITACSCNNPMVNRDKFSSVLVKHGHCQKDWQDKIWSLWKGINDRCSENGTRDINEKYRLLGVCDEWSYENEDGYMNFYSWITSKYEDPRAMIESGYSIDRIDNNKGYHPDNCRLATKTEQARNRKTSVRIKINGCDRLLIEVWEELSIEIPYNAFRTRISNGWTLDEAKSIPLHGSRKSWKK